ncbi:MAG: DUF4089 domain-containing protein [Burkholderiaceae bacterium]
MTTGQSASHALQGEAERGDRISAPQAPPYGGEEAPAFRRERLTPDEIARYVDAAALALELPLQAGHRDGVLRYFELAAGFAAVVEAVPLAAHDDSAVTTGQSASLALQGEVERGNLVLAPQAPPYRGEEAPAFRREGLTFIPSSPESPVSPEDPA